MYRMVAMDPPWPERGGGRIKRGADRHYDVVDYRALPEVVKSSPLWRPDSTGCLVLCWTTVSSCERAYWLLRCLQVEPVSMLYWVKDRSYAVSRDDTGRLVVEGGRFGLGQYTRHDVEMVIIGRIGRVEPPRLMRRSWFFARPGAHSEKPREAYELFEALGDGPRAELFARTVWPGWDVWGDELDKTESINNVFMW